MQDAKRSGAQVPARKSKSGDIPDSLKHFDDLPDAAHVRAPTVAGLYEITTVTVWRWAKAGRIPAPKKFGPKTSGWNVGELRRAREAA